MVEQTDYRLSSDDETKVNARISERVSEWRSTLSRGWRPDITAELVLERAARHAIGCHHYDLTDAENAWVTSRVRAAIDGYKPRGH